MNLKAVAEQVREPAATVLHSKDAWTAPLVIETHHPFFFDHPLEHVPAMLMIFGLLELLDVACGAGGAESGTHLSLSLAFPRFCELTDQVELSVCADPTDDARPWTLRANTASGLVCEGEARLSVGGDLGARLLPGLQATPAAPGDIVHKVRTENILLGPVVVDDSCLTARPREPDASHYLRERGHATSGAGEIIEATRQLANAACHLGLKSPPGSQHLVQGVEAEIPFAVPRGADFWYECPMPSPRTWRAPQLTVRLVTGRESGAAFGEVCWHARVTSQAAYRALREGRRPGREAHHGR